MSNIIDVIKSRRSIRKYRPEKVPRQKILELFAIASYAPSSCNLQAWHFVVVDDDDLKKEIVRKGNVNKQVLLAPTIIIASYDQNVTREHHANYQSLAAAIQNFLLLAHDAGIGTLWVCNFKNEKGIREVLEIPEYQKVLAIIEVGYPTETPKAPMRNPVDTFVTFNRFHLKSRIPGTTILDRWTWDEILNWQKKFVSRGYELEKYTIEEKKKLSSKIVSLLKKGTTIEMYTFSAQLTTGIAFHYPIDYHFAAREINDAAKNFENTIARGRLFIGSDIHASTFKNYSNFLLLNRIEHMPDRTINDVLKNLSECNASSRLLILFRNKYSWYGLYDYFMRFILKQNGIDDIYFGTLRNSGPWKLRSRRWVKKVARMNNYTIVKSFGYFCSPAHRIKDSEWLKLRKWGLTLAAMIHLIFSFVESVLMFVGITQFFGEQILFVCENEREYE